MIRTNHAPSFQSIATLQYRNAVYQGGYDLKNQALAQSGLVYFYDDKHIVACQSFLNDEFNGPSLFIYDSQNYLYGQWNNNKPCGVSVFRLLDTVVIANYEKGVLEQGSSILVILETYNIGVILELGFGDKWRIRERSQIYCQEQVERLLSKCKFKQKQIYLSLLKFINNTLHMKEGPMKLRYVNESYRFGFQQGLAVTFDQLEKIISIDIAQAWIANGQVKSSPIKAGQVYHRNHLMNVKFKNTNFHDPSTQLIEYFRKLLSQDMSKVILSGFIKDNSVYLQKSRHFRNESRQIQVKLCQPTPKESNESFHSRTNLRQKNEQKKSPIKIIDAYESLQTPKKSFFKNLFQSIENKQDSLQKAKEKMHGDQIGSTFVKSKMIKQPVNAFSFLENEKEQTQKIKIISSQLNENQQLQNKISNVEQHSSPSKKSKLKIFDQFSSKKKAFTPLSPLSPQRRESHSKNRMRIFTPKQVKREEILRIENFQKTQIKVKRKQESEEERQSSLIHALKSDKSKTYKQITKVQERELSRSPSGPAGNIVKPYQSSNNRGRTFTQFEDRSSQIVSEDMSNLEELKINKSMQVNNTLPQKLKRQNEVYRKDNKKQAYQQEAIKGRDHGNIPYLQNSLKRLNQGGRKTLISPNPNIQKLKQFANPQYQSHRNYYK